MLDVVEGDVTTAPEGLESPPLDGAAVVVVTGTVVVVDDVVVGATVVVTGTVVVVVGATVVVVDVVVLVVVVVGATVVVVTGTVVVVDVVVVVGATVVVVDVVVLVVVVVVDSTTLTVLPDPNATTARKSPIVDVVRPADDVEFEPRRPLPPLPQHFNVASSRTAHVCAAPALTASAVRPDPRFTAGSEVPTSFGSSP